MKYENADNIFPEKLLLEIRRFMPEGYVYISPQSSRKEWGSVSGQKRNWKKETVKYIRNILPAKVLMQFQKNGIYLKVQFIEY